MVEFLRKYENRGIKIVRVNSLLTIRAMTVSPLLVARATRAATFSVAPGLAPLLFKIDSAATSAASILPTFKRCANR